MVLAVVIVIDLVLLLAVVFVVDTVVMMQQNRVFGAGGTAGSVAKLKTSCCC